MARSSKKMTKTQRVLDLERGGLLKYRGNPEVSVKEYFRNKKNMSGLFI